MIRVTILVENTARGPGILGEHGLAWWIDTGTHRVLFDTGQGMALTHNAARLGVNLAQADAIMLSHGHFDHVGGLETALEATPQAPLFLHPRVVEPKFMGTDPTAARRISIPFVETESFRRGPRRVVATREPSEVAPGVWATGEIPRTNGFEDTGGPFFLDETLTRPDPLLDDQALYLPTSTGTIVLLGCAHAGVVNTLDHIARLTGNAPVRALFGGLHLENASPRRMDETVRALRTLRPGQMGFGHCTGLAAVRRLWSEFPDACLQIHAGRRLEFAS
ncbi:MAG TPA: MBL fold metallo-hydrolase [Opitutaceae bacterium]|nr:MBL fold metallo-hydrolase [Opitutaceae bacterium]